MLINKKKNEILISSYFIDENTQIYYPKPTENNFFTDPKLDEIIKYTPNNITKNSYERYYNEETQIAIIIFSIARKLYIRPEMGYIYPYFFVDIEKQLKKFGLKERKLNTPFSKGAIPANKEWIANYRDIKIRSEEFWNSFNVYADENEDEEDFFH